MADKKTREIIAEMGMDEPCALVQLRSQDAENVAWFVTQSTLDGNVTYTFCWEFKPGEIITTTVNAALVTINMADESDRFEPTVAFTYSPAHLDNSQGGYETANPNRYIHHKVMNIRISITKAMLPKLSFVPVQE